MDAVHAAQEWSAFNRQVLDCQDEAFTLAWYLLGDEALAAQALQAAVMRVYQRSAAGKSLRWQVLRAVAECAADPRCRLLRGFSTPAEEAGSGAREGLWLANWLQDLPESERLAAALVDVLGLSIADAAAVLDQPQRVVVQRLTRARRSLSLRPGVAWRAAQT
jgi:DNA-directed RNA polymerase specialized sigma24 family protein